MQVVSWLWCIHILYMLCCCTLRVTICVPGSSILPSISSHCRARAVFFLDRQQLKTLLLSVKRRNPENSVIVLHGSAIDRLMMVCCCDCHGRLVGITAKAQGNISQALCVISSCFAHSATPALQGAALSLPDDSLLLQLLWRAQERPTAASICCHGRALLSGWCPGSLNS